MARHRARDEPLHYARDYTSRTLTNKLCYRTSAQKPGDDFIANFRQNFPLARASISQEPAVNPDGTGGENAAVGEAPVPDTRYALS